MKINERKFKFLIASKGDLATFKVKSIKSTPLKEKVPKKFYQLTEKQNQFLSKYKK
jgi:hypothetical protein